MIARCDQASFYGVSIFSNHALQALTQGTHKKLVQNGVGADIIVSKVAAVKVK